MHIETDKYFKNSTNLGVRSEPTVSPSRGRTERYKETGQVPQETGTCSTTGTPKH